VGKQVQIWIREVGLEGARAAVDGTGTPVPTPSSSSSTRNGIRI
jgi:hypothetical protein